MLCLPVFGQTTPEEWFYKGNALYNQGKYNEAIQAYDKAIQLNPIYAESWSNKGFALVNQGKYSDAIRAFDKAIQLNPQDTDAWVGKGKPYRGTNNWA